MREQQRGKDGREGGSKSSRGGGGRGGKDESERCCGADRSEEGRSCSYF